MSNLKICWILKIRTCKRKFFEFNFKIMRIMHACLYLGFVQGTEHVFDPNISFAHDLETWSSNHFMHVMFMLCFHISSLSLYNWHAYGSWFYEMIFNSLRFPSLDLFSQVLRFKGWVSWLWIQVWSLGVQSENSRITPLRSSDRSWAQATTL